MLRHKETRLFTNKRGIELLQEQSAELKELHARDKKASILEATQDFSDLKQLLYILEDPTDENERFKIAVEEYEELPKEAVPCFVEFAHIHYFRSSDLTESLDPLSWSIRVYGRLLKSVHQPNQGTPVRNHYPKSAP